MLKSEIDRIIEIFHKYDSFILTGHIDPDGDCIGSEISLAVLLKRWGKQVYIVNPTSAQPGFSFLPHFDWLGCERPESDVQVAIVLDSGNLERTDSLKNYLCQREVMINIDHHGKNSVPGDVNLIDTDVSSVGEIVYLIFQQANEQITPDVAQALYVSIMTDTGCFKHSNTGAQTHRITAELIEAGDFYPHEMYNLIYEQESMETMHLLGSVLKELQSRDGLVWAKVTRDIFEETGATERDLRGVVAHLRYIGGCRVAMLFYEKEDGSVRVSFRAKDSFNLLPVVNSFGGGGHPGAAGATFSGRMHEVENKVLSALEEALKKSN